MEKEIYKNLRQMTVFDLCDDAELLHKLNPLFPKIRTKEQWVSTYKENPMRQVFDLIDLADMTNDLGLKEAIEKEWKKELNAFFDE